MLKHGAKKSETVVLVIEDEPALVDIYATKLESDGYHVLTAMDGVAGLDAAVHDEPAAILLDIIIPLKNGFDVLRELKDNPKTRHIPVIILSNLGQDYEIKQGMALGASGFLVKANLTPAQVIMEVNKVLHKMK